MKAKQLLGSTLIFIAATFLSITAVAAESNEHQFDISAQQLETALKAFSDTTNMQFIYIESRIRTIKTQGVKGQLDNTAALDELLKGTGIRYEFTNDNTVRLYIPGEESDTEKGRSAPDDNIRESRSSGMLEEVVVTARKREESLQDTPIAVTAFTGESLDDRGLTDISQIADFSPSLSIDETSQFAATNSAPAIFIRGIGVSDWALPIDPGVGIYLDDVYISRSVGGVLDLLDLERVEVLRGPQGTLFGRNTIGGAISLTSKKPDFDSLHGYLDVTVGNYSRKNVKGKVNLPINDRLAASFTGSIKKRDGYVDNNAGPDLGDEDSQAYRVAVRWEPTDELSFNLNYDYTREDEAPAPWVLVAVDENGSQVAAWNALRSGNPAVCSDQLNPARLTNPSCMNAQWIQGEFDTSSAHRASFGLTNSQIGKVAPRSELNIWGVGLTAEWNILDNLTIKSISGYRENKDGYWSRDFDHTPLEATTTVNFFEHEQFTQELQFLGTALDERLNWIVGLYYFEEKGRHIDVVQLAGGPPFEPIVINNDVKVDNDSQSLFGQLTYDLTDRLHMTLGARYTDETKRFFINGRTVNQSIPVLRLLPLGWEDITETRTDPYASLSYDINDTSMVYVSYSRGFKGGGFTQRVFPALNFIPSFDPEIATVYEAGFKSMLFDHRLQLNGAAFFTDYEDVQVNASATVFNPNAIGNVIANAAEAEIKGVELEFMALVTDSLRLEGSLVYMDAGFTDTDPFAVAAGINESLDFVNTPEWSGHIGVSYTWDLNNWGLLTARADSSYTSEVYNDAVNTELFRQGGKTLHDFGLIWEDAESLWRVALTVRNASDKTYMTSGLQVNNGLSEATYGIPRTVMFSVKRSFGQ